LINFKKLLEIKALCFRAQIEIFKSPEFLKPLKNEKKMLKNVFWRKALKNFELKLFNFLICGSQSYHRWKFLYRSNKILIFVIFSFQLFITL